MARTSQRAPLVLVAEQRATLKELPDILGFGIAGQWRRGFVAACCQHAGRRAAQRKAVLSQNRLQ